MADELTDALRSAGALLSNCAFNLGLRTPGTILTAEDVSVLKSLARQWDAALATQQAAQGAEPVATVHILRKLHSERMVAHFDVILPEGTKLYTAPPPTAEVEKDAARWRAVKTRYAAALVGRFLPGAGFHSVKSREALDAWADAAHREIEVWDAMSEDEKQTWFSQQAAALQSDQAQVANAFAEAA